MTFFKFVLVVAIAAGGYNYWRQHRGHDTPGSTGVSPGGFVSLPPVRGQSASAVLVIAAENCPHEDAQRADRLADDLSRKGLPVVRTHDVGFDLPGGGRADLDRINAVMNGTLPIVVVRGRAKANPTLDEVVAEFKGSAQ